jgi:intein-encoded DNA endonuclease-like protein
MQDLIEGLSSSRGSTILIPRSISPTLVEILGRFCGDGSCGIYDSSNYKFSLKERSGSFVELHSRDMKEIFAVKGRVVHYPRVSENVIYSKPLVLLFQQLFKYRDGFHKSLHVKPPELLDNLDWDLRKGFTTGLIDTEGSFYYDQSTRTVIFEIKMINSSLIQEVEKAFKEFDIQFNYSALPKADPTIFRIRSYGKKTLRLLKDVFEPKNQRHLSQFQSLRL